MKTYAGIGSRQTPQAILALMTLIAASLRVQGYTLLSGHAPGADQAFEAGAEENCASFLPWPSFEKDVAQHPGATVVPNPSPSAVTLAAKHHPAWAKLKQGARKLHARNCHQVLGRDLNSPVQFVLCWTPDGKATGGTGQAIRIAEAHGVPVYNLHDPAIRSRLTAMVAKTHPHVLDAQDGLVEAPAAPAPSDTTVVDRKFGRADGRPEFWSGYADPVLGMTLYS